MEQALDDARGGEVVEGCVGTRTGMHLFGYKGGIGTSSRMLPDDQGGWTVGVLVLTNIGRRPRLTIAGVPAGLLLDPPGPQPSALGPRDEGSGIVVVATNAPLVGRQMARVAKHAALGLARTGSTGGNSSGDLLVAFSTGYRPSDDGVVTRAIVKGGAIDPIFTDAVDAPEEAVLNALFMATTTAGWLGRIDEVIPIDQVRTIRRERG